MKQRFTFTVLFFLMWAGISALNGQTLVIKTKSGPELVKPLGTVHSVTFSDSYLLMNYFGGLTESYSVSSISKLYFKPVVTATEIILTDRISGTLSVYPNPADDILHIQNAPAGKSILSIYRIDGTIVLLKQNSTQIESVDISNLTSGLYFLKINNQAIKFIRE